MNARCGAPRSKSVSAACVALALGCLLALPAPAGAQRFYEIGGGWNYLAPAPEGDGYTRGFNIRASLGWQLAPRVRLRFDAFTSQFDDSVQLPPPICLAIYVCAPFYNVEPVRVAGLTANGLLNVDPRGILYVIGGAGFYDVYGRPGSHDAGLRVGVSAGAGISVPVGGRLHAFVEARHHELLFATTQPPWLVPITVGVRFR